MKTHVAAEPHPLRECARDERRGDDRELALEHGEHEVRDAVAADRAVDAAQEHEAGVPAEPAAQDVGTEGHRVADSDPDDADHRHGGEAVHHRAQDVLGPDEAAVEHRQARDHQQHEGRGRQHPGRGAGVDRRLVRRDHGRRRRDADHDRADEGEQQRRRRHRRPEPYGGSRRFVRCCDHPSLLRSQGHAGWASAGHMVSERTPRHASHGGYDSVTVRHRVGGSEPRAGEEGAGGPRARPGRAGGRGRGDRRAIRRQTSQSSV